MARGDKAAANAAFRCDALSCEAVGCGLRIAASGDRISAPAVPVPLLGPEAPSAFGAATFRAVFMGVGDIIRKS